MSEDASAQLKSEKTKDIRSTNIIAAKGKSSRQKVFSVAWYTL